MFVTKNKPRTSPTAPYPSTNDAMSLSLRLWSANPPENALPIFSELINNEAESSSSPVTSRLWSQVTLDSNPGSHNILAV